VRGQDTSLSTRRNNEKEKWGGMAHNIRLCFLVHERLPTKGERSRIHTRPWSLPAMLNALLIHYSAYFLHSKRQCAHCQLTTKSPAFKQEKKRRKRKEKVHSGQNKSWCLGLLHRNIYSCLVRALFVFPALLQLP
jgi:hypothetical protein